MFGFDDLIGAVAGPLIGGLFGGGSDKTQTSEVDYVKLRDNAMKAGFNPLTALRNGGSAGFTVTTMPGLSTGEFVGQALSDGIQAWASYDPLEEENKKLQNDLLKKRISLAEKESMAFPSAPMISDGGSQPIASRLTYHRKEAPPKARPMMTADGRMVRQEPVRPLYVGVYDQMTKRTVMVPNPDFTESGPTEMANGMAVIGAADFAQNGIRPALTWGRDQLPDISVSKGMRPSEWRKLSKAEKRKRYREKVYGR